MLYFIAVISCTCGGRVVVLVLVVVVAFPSLGFRDEFESWAVGCWTEVMMPRLRRSGSELHALQDPITIRGHGK